MPKRVPKQSITVFRDGKPVNPEIGKPFEFEEQELADIERINPDAVSEEATVDLTKAEKKKKTAATEGSGEAGSETL